jgi:hypothetical protein
VLGYVYYVWGPELAKLWPGQEEEEQPLRRKPGRQGEEIVARPAPRKPGKKPKHDWPKHVARHVIQIIRSGQDIPTARDIAQWCEDTLDYQPDISELQKLLKFLLG